MELLIRDSDIYNIPVKNKIRINNALTYYINTKISSKNHNNIIKDYIKKKGDMKAVYNAFILYLCDIVSEIMSFMDDGDEHADLIMPHESGPKFRELVEYSFDIGIDYIIFLRPEYTLLRCEYEQVIQKQLPLDWGRQYVHNFELRIYNELLLPIAKEIIYKHKGNPESKIEILPPDLQHIINDYSDLPRTQKSNTHIAGISGSPRTKGIDIYPKNIMGFSKGSPKKKSKSKPKKSR